MNKAALFFILSIYTTSFLHLEAQSPNQPNIIYILADDLGYGDLGCYGQDKIETPNLDALARQGMKFSQHYAGSPVCAPSRYMFLTGKHPGHAFIRSNHEWGERGDTWDYKKAVHNIHLEGQYPIPDSTTTLGETLQFAGYTTALVGKWGLGAPETEGVPNNQGFDYFYGYNCQRQAHNLYPPFLWENDKKIWLENEIVVPGTKLPKESDPMDIGSYDLFHQKDYAPAKMQEAALGFIERHKDHPFFLYYASPIPHVPLQVPPEWYMKYVNKFGDEEPYLGDQGYFPHRYPRAAYAGMISYLDQQVGELIDKLKEEGLYDNTLIIFTSDNGPTFNGGSDSPWFGSGGPFPSEKGRGKGYVYEAGIRVPFIAAWPGVIEAGSQSDVISAFWDMMPTFDAIAGAKTPSDVDGVNLLPVLEGRKDQLDREYLYWEFPSYGGQQAVRMGPWKAIRQNINKGNIAIELYNLDNDLREQHNVANQHPDIVKKMTKIMAKEHEEPELERFRMEALGDVK
ncbi:arylsulfatase [Membranicola marinus]|uniref:Arylsulfatase n=1 Tax=Membranihabitans marinus TaxID=1227546 RepID=A0A953LCD3_9BACT|nr:arylsulfatase [Membranihabitans marinus]MBY5957644.1 arylsulfatase [Membranihabitans marinus]